MAYMKYCFSSKALNALKLLYSSCAEELRKKDNELSRLASLSEILHSPFSKAKCAAFLDSLYEDVSKHSGDGSGDWSILWHEKTGKGGREENAFKLVTFREGSLLFRLNQDLRRFRIHAIRIKSCQKDELSCSNDTLVRAFPDGALLQNRGAVGITNRKCHLDLFSFILTGVSFEEFKSSARPLRGLSFDEDVLLVGPAQSPGVGLGSAEEGEEEEAEPGREFPGSEQEDHRETHGQPLIREAVAKETTVPKPAEMKPADHTQAMSPIAWGWIWKEGNRLTVVASVAMVAYFATQIGQAWSDTSDKPTVQEMNVNFYTSGQSPNINIANGNLPLMTSGSDSRQMSDKQKLAARQNAAASQEMYDDPFVLDAINPKLTNLPTSKARPASDAQLSLERLTGVLSNVDGSPLPYARISLQDGSSTVTDTEGRFALPYPSNQKNTTSILTIFLEEGTPVTQEVTLNSAALNLML